ncbi:MAG: copper amine oxidase N-terminal domain-containing protein [Pseudomonadota bacterium]
MKRFKFLSSIITLVLIAAMTLSGCNARDKLELLNALEKTASINSYESNSQIRFVNVTFDTNIEDLLELQLLIPLFDNLSFDIRQKAVQNTAKTILKAKSDLKIMSTELSDQFTTWVYYDFENQPPVARQIIKLPESIASSLPEDLAGKEYFVMDQKDLSPESQLDPKQYADLAEELKNMQSSMIQLLKEYAIDKNTGFVVVNQLEDQFVNGEKMSLYQLKLDNKSFMEVLKYALTEYSENEQVKELLGGLILAAGSFAAGTEGGSDLEMAYAAITDGEASLKDEVGRIMAALKNVTLLGSRGIEVNFLIDKNGYIVNQNGVFDFFINSQQIEDAFEIMAGDTAYDGKEIYFFTFGMAMEFNTDMSNINQDISVNLPVITAENSFDFDDFIGIAPSFGKNLIGYGSKAVKLDYSSASPDKVYPVKLGAETFVPLEPIRKSLGYKLTEQKSGEFSLKTGKMIIKGKAGSTEVLAGDRKYSLTLPVMRIENQIFVPEQFVKDCLGIGIYYDEQSKTLIIQKKP